MGTEENLYGRLFRYRERSACSPLEDFLSEGLADLLNRAPPDRSRSIVEALLGEDRAALRKFKETFDSNCEYRWTTQVGIDWPQRGLIDLLLEIDGRPAIVVENKIASSIRRFGDRDDEVDDDPPPDQVACYGQWLSRECKNGGWPGAAVLLTHHTSIGPEFLDPKCQAYGVPFRNVAYWSQIYRLLEQQNTENSGTWFDLATEFRSFMMSEGLSQEFAGLNDIAALQLFLPVADRVFALVDHMWDKPSQETSVFIRTKPDAEIDSETGQVWKYRYLSHPKLKWGFISSGIRFPQCADQHADIAGDGRPQLFVKLGIDNVDATEVVPSPSGKNPGWVSSEKCWVAIRPLTDFPTDPEELAKAAQAWVAERLKELAAVIQQVPIT